MVWRVGRKLGRTLYCDDVCVGMVDTPEIAAAIVRAMNDMALIDLAFGGTCEACGRKDCWCVDCGAPCSHECVGPAHEYVPKSQTSLPEMACSG